MKGRKYYTDRERMETVKRLRASGLSISRFARENGISYATLRDWAYAFRDLEYALENVGRKPIEDILPYSKNLEIA